MARLCERPDCAEPGAVAYGFDADRLLVWLAPMQAGADPNRAGMLCLRHADSLVVPIGWSLDDARQPIPRLFNTSAAPADTALADTAPADAAPTGKRASAPKPTRRRRRAAPASTNRQLRLDTAPQTERTVAAVSGVSSAAEDDPDATVAIPWMPEFDQSDNLGGALDASSPLLARAFRGAARPR